MAPLKGLQRLLLHGISRMLADPGVSRAVMRTATRLDGPLLRWSRGRLRLSFVIPCLLLRCRGAVTGRIREVPLLYVPDGDDVLLVGSGGGSVRTPAWVGNLRAYPRVTCLIAGEERSFRIRELEGTERAEAWRKALCVYPGYAAYADRLERTIPLFRLISTASEADPSG